jgi:hypothetical protein
MLYFASKPVRGDRYGVISLRTPRYDTLDQVERIGVVTAEHRDVPSPGLDAVVGITGDDEPLLTIASNWNARDVAAFGIGASARYE